MREVLTYPNEELRQTSRPVEDSEFGRPMEEFIEELYTLMDQENGVGLAAPQVGVYKNILVYKTMGEDEETKAYLINPNIVETEGKTLVEEGCLSIPGVFAKVPRAVKITVEAQNIEGETFCKTTDVFSAVIIQHETDHLFGKLFIDRLSLIKRKLLLAQYNQQN